MEFGREPFPPGSVFYRLFLGDCCCASGIGCSAGVSFSALEFRREFISNQTKNPNAMSVSTSTTILLASIRSPLN